MIKLSKKDGLIKRLLAPINPNSIIFLGVYTILWGLWLIAPMWDVFTAAALFSQMHALAPEWVWGTIAVVSGIATAYGAIKPSYTTLTVGAMIGCLHWLNVSIMFFIGDWHNTGGITALAISIFAAYIYLNVKVNKLNGDDDA